MAVGNFIYPNDKKYFNDSKSAEHLYLKDNKLFKNHFDILFDYLILKSSALFSYC